MPLAVFTESVAATLFVGLSTVLLAYGLTRDGWYRLPLFISEAFLSSARLGQWSILITASLFLPWLAVFSAAKPQSSLPIIAGSASRKVLVFSLIGALVLVSISTLLQPYWISAWISAVRNSQHMNPPISRLGGFLIFAALLRWRRPESWLVVTLACMPQSWGWYGALPLFTIPATFAQSVFLAAAATLGLFAATLLMPAVSSLDQFYSRVGAVIVCSTYLPAVILILRRSNEGTQPAWIALLRRRHRGAGSESGNAPSES